MREFVLLATIFFSVVSVNAQFRFGVKAGGNFSNLYTNDKGNGLNSDQYNGRFSYHFGGMLEYSLSDLFSIQPELIYLNHGANLKKNNSFLMQDGHITLNTLQMPINLKAQFGFGNYKLFAYAGPYLSYNIYGKVEGKVDGIPIDQDLYSKDSKMKRWDYGIGFGVGIEKNGFILGLGNQYGLQNISGSKPGKMKPGNITLSVGYFF
jgi:hypothetical protein